VGDVIWHPRAERDLEAIYDYIARDSPAMARAFIERIRTATEHLPRFPESGRIVPERKRGDVREVLVESYRVMYRRKGQDIHVLMVRHGARRHGRGA
jgi:plasmid stabilization system protein ParE